MRFCDLNAGIAQDEAIHVTATTLVCFPEGCPVVEGIPSLLKKGVFVSTGSHGGSRSVSDAGTFNNC